MRGKFKIIIFQVIIVSIYLFSLLVLSLYHIMDLSIPSELIFFLYGCVGYLTHFIISSGLSWKRKNILNKFLIFSLIMLVSLIIPFIIHYVFYNDNIVEEEAILSLFGSYLSFVGTFSLGFIIYERDKINKIDEKITKAKLLHATIDSTISQLSRLSSNSTIVKSIEYDRQWQEYYFEISSLGLKNELELKNELKNIFNYVDLINLNLEQGKVENAKNLYALFIKKEQYSTTKFNYIEALGYIYHIAYLWKEVEFDIPWDEEKENKHTIEKYGEQYFTVIELWIWNYMIKHKISCLKLNEIQFELVDWLMTNINLSKLVISPYDKRI